MEGVSHGSMRQRRDGGSLRESWSLGLERKRGDGEIERELR